MSEWLQAHEAILWWLGVVSGLAFLATLAAIPWLVVRIPVDYFTRDSRPSLPWSRVHPVLRMLLHLVKNLLGAVLVLCGLAMLVLPGQGILTILLGVMLLDFPRKYELERWLASRPAVLRALNWIRNRAGVPPIVIPIGSSG